jgi:hypothetical protein
MLCCLENSRLNEAKKKCNKHDLKAFEGCIESIVKGLDAGKGEHYKKDSGKCNSAQSLKVELFSLLLIIILSFCLK